MLYILGPVLVALSAYLLIRQPLLPQVWHHPSPLPRLEGPLAVNDILTHATHFTDDYIGAESFAFDRATGHVYSGFSDGTVGEFDRTGKLISRVFFSGGFVASLATQAPGEWVGNGLNPDTDALYAFCRQEAAADRLPWNATAEKMCGRPLGLRFREEGSTKCLYIADAYHGIIRLDLKYRNADLIIGPEEPVSACGEIASCHVDAYRPRAFFNDLDLLPNGDIVFSDSSYKYGRANNRIEVLDGAPRGRLFIYQRNKKRLFLLLCGIHFANGVQLMENGKDVLVVELARFRTLRVNIAKMATLRPFKSCGEASTLSELLSENDFDRNGVEIFTSSMPGIPDNIRLSGGKNVDQPLYYVGMGSVNAQPFALLWYIYQYEWIRLLIGSLIPMKFIENLAPRYGLVTAYDGDGQAVYSLHDPTGKVVYHLSHADRHPITGDLWLGSHGAPGHWILPAKYLPKA